MGAGGNEGGAMQRDLGKLEANVEALKEQVQKLTEQVAKLTSAFDKAKGGYLALATVAALLGGLASHVAAFFKLKLIGG